jgi:hypothetical protein
MYTSEQTRVLTGSRIVLQEKDCSVGQSISFSLTSTTRTCAEDIGQHVLRTRQNKQQFVSLCRSVSQQRQKGKKYASPSNSINSDRRRCPSVAGESFHPDGRQYQIDFECSRCDWCGVVASRRIWIVSLSVPSPHRIVSAAEFTEKWSFADREPELRIEHMTRARREAWRTSAP